MSILRRACAVLSAIVAGLVAAQQMPPTAEPPPSPAPAGQAAPAPGAEPAPGADWSVSPQVYLGAFVSNSFGRYDKLVLSDSGGSVSGDIAKKRVHDWLQLGLRLRYDL